jgi:two-component system, cell cycle response regulator
MKLIAGSIFKGKGMATASTWAIINYIIIFLGLISSVFYFTHIRQRKGGMFDPLTGAFSKRYIMDRLKEEVKIAKGTGGHCSLMVMDMDKFKTINDTYGHSAGDMILKEFVIAIRKAIRATDLLGRFGGDEFVIVLPTAENTKALQVAEEIADSVRNHDIKIEKKKVTVTCSIGVAAFPEDSGTADDLFNKADKALYTVKQRGRDGAALFQA